MRVSPKRLQTKPIVGIQHEIGFSYKAVITFLLPVSRFFPVKMWLLENGKTLPGPAHALHEEIRYLGAGRFSFWNGTVYFSTLDNSDPRTNGRIYTIEYIPNLFTRIIGLLPGRLWRIFVILFDHIGIILNRVWRIFAAMFNRIYVLTRRILIALIPQSLRHFAHRVRIWTAQVGPSELPWELFYWLCFALVILRGKIIKRPFS